MNDQHHERRGCRSCRWFSEPLTAKGAPVLPRGSDLALCHNPSLVLVRPAIAVRATACGEEGALWEPIPNPTNAVVEKPKSDAIQWIVLAIAAGVVVGFIISVAL